MHERTAARLARRAGRVRRDGSRGPLARAALRSLIAAGDRGEQAAAEAVWQVWLRHPDDGVWEALTRWREPPDLAEAALVAAMAARTADARAAIGAFCASRGLTPANPVLQVLFFVLTGQAEQHRALDPDESLLATAYRGAGQATQAHLRQAIVCAGDLDLVRVVAGERGDRVVQVTGEEAGYLARQLAARQEWEQLWWLMKQVPVRHAADLARLFAGWQPADPDGRRLLRQLAEPRLREIAPGWEPAAREQHVRLTLPRGTVAWNASFAPDASQMVVLQSRGERNLNSASFSPPLLLCVYELPSGKLVQRARIPREGYHSGVLHLGDAVLVIGRRSYSESLILFPAAGPPRVLREGVRIGGFAYVPGGFAAATGTGLLFGSATGSETRTVESRRLGLSAAVTSLAGDPDSGRVAVHTARELVMADPEGQVIARTASPEWIHEIRELAFAGPDRLVTLEYRTRSGPQLTLWERKGETLAAKATAEPPGFRMGQEYKTLLAAAPLLGRVCVCTRSNRIYNSERSQWYDLDTLEVTTGPRVLGGHADLWSSASGDRIAAVGRGHGHLDLYQFRAPSELGDLADKPMAAMQPADLATLATVERRLERVNVSPDIEDLTRLLRACLEYRFRTDIQVGAANRPASETHDISLSDGSTPSP